MRTGRRTPKVTYGSLKEHSRSLLTLFLLSSYPGERLSLAFRRSHAPSLEPFSRLTFGRLASPRRSRLALGHLYPQSTLRLSYATPLLRYTNDGRTTFQRPCYDIPWICLRYRYTIRMIAAHYPQDSN